MYHILTRKPFPENETFKRQIKLHDKQKHDKIILIYTLYTMIDLRCVEHFDITLLCFLFSSSKSDTESEWFSNVTFLMSKF